MSADDYDYGHGDNYNEHYGSGYYGDEHGNFLSSAASAAASSGRRLLGDGYYYGYHNYHEGGAAAAAAAASGGDSSAAASAASSGINASSVTQFAIERMLKPLMHTAACKLHCSPKLRSCAPVPCCKSLAVCSYIPASASACSLTSCVDKLS